MAKKNSPKAAKRGKPEMPRRAKKKKFPVFKTILVVIFAFAVLLGLGGALFYATVELPNPNEEFTTQTTTLYYDDGKTELGRLAIQNREAIAYDQMPDNLKDAVVAAEDRSFWSNQGIDPVGMARAAFGIIRNREISGGGSTITQQYIKILYLTSEQKLSRKLKELALAMKMNQAESKETVLAGYLNTIYFGRGAYGVQAAAQAFFGVDAKDPTLPQSVVLASVINAPSNYDPQRGQAQAQNLAERYQYVLDGMLEMGTISQEEHDEASAGLPEIPNYVAPNTYSGPNGFLVHMATEELRAKGFTEEQINGGGLKITTTFNEQRQKDAVAAVDATVEEVMAKARTKPDENGNQVKPNVDDLHTGVVSINVKTGEVIALYGGKDFVQNSRNWATTPRYPASTFKAYGVIAGLRNGFGLNSVLRGNTFTPEGDTVPVHNNGGANYGPVTLKKATNLSLNTPFIDMLHQIPNGYDELVRAATDAGVPEHPSWKEQGGRLVLGMGEVSVLDNTAGFSTIANQGMRATPHTVKKVEDHSGSVLYEADDNSTRTIEDPVARDTISALMREPLAGQAVAYKTGTEGVDAGQDGAVEATNRSGWTVGFSPSIATGVMMVCGPDGQGNLNDYMPAGASFYGMIYPHQIWQSYMAKAFADMPNEQFPAPGNISPTIGPTYIPSTVASAPQEEEEAEETERPVETQEPEPRQTQTLQPAPAATETRVQEVPEPAEEP